MDKNITRKLRVIGSPADVAKFESLTSGHNFEVYQEAHARGILQGIIENNTFDSKFTVLFDGNTVWNTKRLLKDLKTIVKHDDMNKMTDYLYKFFSLSCGSIAHYNKYGWIDTYPTVSDLRRFFRRNEFGQSVLSYIPSWKSDVYNAVDKMTKLLKA